MVKFRRRITLRGPLGLLETNAADVVFLAHTGFEGADTFRAALSGALVHRTIRLCYWRVPFAQIPQEPSARTAWLFDQWTRVDEWIDAHRVPEAARRSHDRLHGY